MLTIWCKQRPSIQGALLNTLLVFPRLKNLKSEKKISVCKKCKFCLLVGVVLGVCLFFKGGCMWSKGMGGGELKHHFLGPKGPLSCILHSS